jgi:hypothetical protein
MNLDKMEYTYEIAGKTYIQRPLVLGQLKQLSAVMKHEIPSEINMMGVIDILSDVFPDILAISLTEGDTPIKEKNIPALTALFREFVDIGMIVKIMNGMFCLEPGIFLLSDTAGLNDWIENTVSILAEGNAEKRDEILWNYTFRECKYRLFFGACFEGHCKN